MTSKLVHALLFHAGWGNAVTYDLMIVTCWTVKLYRFAMDTFTLLLFYCFCAFVIIGDKGFLNFKMI